MGLPHLQAQILGFRADATASDPWRFANGAV
jgi:hypothetical protein